MKRVPLRTCVVSREKCEKKDLLRVVRTPEKEVIFDETGKHNGRGVYLKKDKEVILKAQKYNVLSKILEVEVPDDIYSELLRKVENE